MQCSTAPALVSVHMTIVHVLFKHSNSCTVYNELSAVKCVYGDRSWAKNNYYLYCNKGGNIFKYVAIDHGQWLRVGS